MYIYRSSGNIVSSNGKPVVRRFFRPSRTDLYGWWDPSDITADNLTVDGQKVSMIADKSGNEHHLTQIDDEKMPFMAKSPINGLNSLSTGYNVNDEWLWNDTFTMDGSGDVALFAVVRIIDNTVFQSAAIFSMDEVGADRDWQWDTWNNGQTESVIETSNIGVGNLSTTGGPWLYSTHIVNVNLDYTGGIMNGYIDGVKVTADGTYTSKIVNPIRLQWMVNRGRNKSIIGDYGELVATKAAGMTEVVRQKMEGYLAHKWGTVASLPSNHPYKTFRP